MEDHSHKPSSIDDALRVLDEALGGVNPPALNELISSEFRNLKSAIGNSPLGVYGAESYEKIAQVATMGFDEARRIGGEVDRGVRSNPWPYLGGVAIGTFALGVILGRSGGSHEQIRG